MVTDTKVMEGEIQERHNYLVRRAKYQHKLKEKEAAAKENN